MVGPSSWKKLPKNLRHELLIISLHLNLNGLETNLGSIVVSLCHTCRWETPLVSLSLEMALYKFEITITLTILHLHLQLKLW